MSHKWNHNFPKIAREAGFTIRELSIGHCIDWRFIASIDPYAIVSERDYEKLDEFIPHISEVPIGTVLNNRILDPAIGKYFVLAQFSVQYLLFCKQFLDETVVEIRNTAQDVQKENTRLEKICRKKNEEIVSLHRKLQRAENAHGQQIYPCSKCTKNFISLDLLNAHVARKHVELAMSDSKLTGRKLSETDSNLINTIKLELEVKQLKERLNAAEKDLIDQRSREHTHCHGCTDSRTKDREIRDYVVKVTAPEFHSIGIQSNLEDSKDVNEKEVQTSIRSRSETPTRLSPISRLTPSPTLQQLPLQDYISKADLDAIVQDQKEQFENWKSMERQKFNHEIEQVRHNLTEAIRELEKRDRIASPPPPPAVVMVDRKEDVDSIWKQRYHELEQMYENSQRQVRNTVESIESVYEEKFRQFERMIERKEAIAKRERDETAQAVEKMISDSKVAAKPVPQQKVHEDIAQKTSAQVNARKIHVSEQEESEIDEAIDRDSGSEEMEQTESDEEIRALEAAKAKFLVRPIVSSPVEEEKKNVTKPEQTLMSPKKQILNTFKVRLKALGIDSRTKMLAKEDLQSASEALAERRDASKKKNRGFFITRNQLLAKVDQIAKSKMKDPGKAKPTVRLQTEEQLVILKRESVAEPSQPVPKLRSSFQFTERKPSIDLLPSKLKLPSDDRLALSKQTITTPNIFKAKFASSYLTVPEVKLTSDDIITVQAEINTGADYLATRSPVPTLRSSPPRPSVSDYDRHLERLLDTPVKRVGAPPDLGENQRREENESELSDILEAVPLQPRPVPKKRVLFNLDRDNSGSGGDKVGFVEKVGPTFSSTVIEISKAEEESDWNISSFEDEK